MHTSIKLIEMNQGISFLPIYITTDSDYNISVINTKILQAPISFTYIYSKKKVQKYWRLLDHLKSILPMNNYNKFQIKTKNAINHHILGSILFMNFSTLNVKLLSEFKLTLIVVPSGNPL